MALTVFPTLTFNTSTGSDTAASGAGPGTAVTGTAAAHTNGAASTTITFTNSPDLSGVAQDGSHVLWLKTASGRQFSRISTVDNVAKTCVVEDSFNIASGSAVNYAIGAKRNTWDNADSRLLFTADVKAGWNVATDSDQTLNTSAVALVASGDLTNGAVNITGSSGAIRVITQTANAAHFNLPNSFYRWTNLKFANSNGTKTSANAFATGQGTHYAYGCVFGDATNTINIGVNATTGTISLTMVNCEINKTASHGISCNQAGRMVLSSCWIHAAQGTGNGISLPNGGFIELVVERCIISGNAGDGLNIGTSGTNTRPAVITNCVIHGNSGDGIDLSGAAGAADNCVIINNNITGNGNFGIRGIGTGATTDRVKGLIDFNNFGSGGTVNTSGALSNITAGANDLAVDPGYTNAAGNDFSCGTNVKAKGNPIGGTTTVGLNSSTYDYVDVGIQRQEPTGGGIVGMSHIIQNIGTY